MSLELSKGSPMEPTWLLETQLYISIHPPDPLEFFPISTHSWSCLPFPHTLSSPNPVPPSFCLLWFFLFPLLCGIEESSFDSSFLLTFLQSLVCIMVNLYFLANIHLPLNTYPACHFGPGFPYSGWYFPVPSICLQNLWCPRFSSWIVLRCVTQPHFLHPFFSWGTPGLLPLSACYKYGCCEHSAALILIVL